MRFFLQGCQVDAGSWTLVAEIWMVFMAAVGPGQVVSEEG